jgi:Zn finger protein HypA/HybF involved in hydrogenase expression
MFNEWDNPEAIQEIINKSKSKREVLERMGYNKENGHRLQMLRSSIRKFDLDISFFESVAYYRQTPGAFNDWDNPDAIQEILNRSKSKRDALVNMGYSKSNGHKLRFLMIAIEKYKLDTFNFHSRTDRWDNLEEIVKDCYCYADVADAVGIKPIGGNIRTVKKYIIKRGLDISHFKRNVGSGNPTYRKKESEILCENSLVCSSTLRGFIKRNNSLKYECVKCGIVDEWMGESIVLELDHINGVNNDNRIENLRFLCPNCHSQTPTHRNKKRK